MKMRTSVLPVTVLVIAQIITGSNSLSRHGTLKMPPVDTASRTVPLSPKRHTSDFSARKNHPTAYESSPSFKGPLVLPSTLSTSDHRIRMKNFYLDNDNLQQQGECALPLKPTANTDLILKTIMDHFAFHDAPVDVKEMAESMEFYLRTRKRLMGMAKKRIMKNARSGNGDEDSICTKCEVNEEIVQVFDMCSGHGLTGMLFAACNPPKATQNNRTLVVETHLVDVVEPLSHVVLRELIADVCPWIKDNVYFHACRLEELITTNDRSTDVSIECSNENDSDTAVVAGSCPIVIATHACGKLTDQVLHQAVDMNACAIAAMPCCYTGTDKGVSYGIRRALGVAWAADIRRTQFLDDNKYHVDYATIPLEITPLNRIIMAEERL